MTENNVDTTKDITDHSKDKEIFRMKVLHKQADHPLLTIITTNEQPSYQCNTCSYLTNNLAKWHQHLSTLAHHAPIHPEFEIPDPIPPKKKKTTDHNDTAPAKSIQENEEESKNPELLPEVLTSLGLF